SNLRQALLVSALDSTYDPDIKMFDNVNDQIHNKLLKNLSGIEKLHRDEALLEFNQQAANQFDARIKEEGRNLIRD
ncbi:10969_t:CDS:2, partial [Ambispora gerdemannii]